MNLKLAINFILLSLLGVLIFQNQNEITIQFFSDFRVSTAVFIVIVLIYGIIIGKLLTLKPSLNDKPAEVPISNPATVSNINIFVGNLARNVHKNDLQDTFEKFGTVKSVKIIKDKHSGNPRGFGFVEMQDKTSAQQAIKKLNGYELHGKVLNVNEAHPRAANQHSRISRQRNYR